MGRLQTRLAIQSAIQGAGIIYVGTVYPARPVIATETAYVETLSGMAIEESDNGSSCVIVVNIPSDDRSRYADVGRGAVADWNKHLICLELFFASLGGDGVAAQEDYDTIVDALMTFIRQNPTMSAPATVWSAGEYRYGVKHQQDGAYNPEESTAVLINGVIRFESWEQDVGSF